MFETSLPLESMRQDMRPPTPHASGVAMLGCTYNVPVLRTTRGNGKSDVMQTSSQRNGWDCAGNIARECGWHCNTSRREEDRDYNVLTKLAPQ